MQHDAASPPTIAPAGHATPTRLGGQGNTIAGRRTDGYAIACAVQVKIAYMNVLLVPTKLRVAPGYPVEITTTVDGESLQVALEWTVVERWVQTGTPTADSVREAILARRSVIERTVQARVFAHGMPISGELTLSTADFPAAR